MLQGVKWVWIDKLCINQDDLLERSQQIQLMNSIYSQATQTLIWLGTDYSVCSMAWPLIDQIYNILQIETQDAKFVSEIPFRMYSDQQHTASGLPEWDDNRWQHLRGLFELPWFTRTWIIQEVTLSRQDPILLHGHHIYPWHRLGWAASWLRRNGYLRLAQIPQQYAECRDNFKYSEISNSLASRCVTSCNVYKLSSHRSERQGVWSSWYCRREQVYNFRI